MNDCNCMEQGGHVDPCPEHGWSGVNSRNFSTMVHTSVAEDELAKLSKSVADAQRKADAIVQDRHRAEVCGYGHTVKADSLRLTIPDGDMEAECADCGDDITIEPVDGFLAVHAAALAASVHQACELSDDIGEETIDELTDTRDEIINTITQLEEVREAVQLALVRAVEL